MQKHRSKGGNIATESIILYPDCKQVSSLDLPVHNFTGIYKLSAFAVVFWISLAGELGLPCSDRTKKREPSYWKVFDAYTCADRYYLISASLV